ncbi:hypothetical protein [Synoicihabitans lomoniglobus]|uniref:Secreted protein n=1 Tax=Synoicihabitans lomoniglobus TaxID=2909285 RepID=A0AAE9ZVB4_9BACT|nr:hypothetical protein [Opitutaceae bacterium LMO-M01]WED63490.1 hypothetical protein PXH66_14210 [Opitutaceae bacterium LMO-M01]
MDTAKHRFRNAFALVVVGLWCFAAPARAAETVLDFEGGALGEWIPTWEEQGVALGLAWKPTESTAEGSLTFFPHIGTENQGILAAMADEPIPLEARFPVPVSRVVARCWAHTGSAAMLEAFDNEGNQLDFVRIERVPQRTDPSQPMPTFELEVSGKGIAYVRFSGPREGEYLAVDELRFVID